MKENAKIINSPKFKKGSGSFDRHENIVAFLFVLTPIIGFLIFTVGSMIFSTYYSFTNYNPVTGITKPVQLKNYIDLFTSIVHSKAFVGSIFNTIILLLSVPLSMLFGLIFAGLLNNSDIKGSKFFRIIYYLPAVSSAVALNIIWRYIFNNEFGIINHLIGQKINWLSDDLLVKVAIIIKNTWGGIGGTLILYLAGMLSVPRDYYEAASIDGASKFKQFMLITLPMITPITFYLMIVGLIGGLQSYVDSDIFANGDSGAQTIVHFVWQRGIGQSRFGIASAASILLALVIMLITLIQFKLSDKWVYEG